MADGVGMKVRRKDELFRKLSQLVPETAKELAIANNASADEMVARAKSFVAVKSGTLRDSIRKEPAEGVAAVRVVAGGASTTKAVRAGADASYDYALGQEFGTSEARGQPFFFPAFRLIRKRHKARATRAINKAAKAVSGK
jgi:HK97 gp10 family phage protein